MIDFIAGDVSYDVWQAKQTRLADASREVARRAELVGTYESCVLRDASI